MSCPYLASIADDGNNSGNVNNEHDTLPTTNGDDQLETEEGNRHEEPLNYTTYLRTEQLLMALKCLSHTDSTDNTSPPVHDEHFFILIHQGE